MYADCCFSSKQQQNFLFFIEIGAFLTNYANFVGYF